MREIKWNSELEELAQTLADSNKITIDDAKCIIRSWIDWEEVDYNAGDYDDARD